jgi:hypothetical protein
MDLSPEEAACQRNLLKKEAVLLSSVHHRNIVKSHGLCVDSSSRAPKYIVLERADMSLTEFLRLEGSIGVEMLDQLSRDILRGLQVLHSKSVLHSDMKCDNILVFRTPGCVTVKLCDFDLSKKLNLAATTEYDGGAALYSAPETSKGHVGIKADMFSFGVLLAEIVVGFLETGSPAVRLPLKVVDPCVPSDQRKLLDAALLKLGPGHYLSELIQGCTNADEHGRWSATLSLLFLEHVPFRHLCSQRPTTTEEWSLFVVQARLAAGQTDAVVSPSENVCVALLTLVSQVCLCSARQYDDSAWLVILGFMKDVVQCCWPTFAGGRLFCESLRAFVAHTNRSPLARLVVDEGLHEVLQTIANDIDVDVLLRLDCAKSLIALDATSDGFQLYRNYLDASDTPKVEVRGFLFPRFMGSYAQDVFCILRAESLEISDEDEFATFTSCLRLLFTLGTERPDAASATDQVVWFETVRLTLGKSDFRASPTVAQDGLSTMSFLLTRSTSFYRLVTAELFESTVGLVCRILAHHVSHPGVQEKGCFLLANLYASKALSLIPLQRIFLTYDVTLPAVVASMVANSQWAAVREAACCTISNVTGTVDPASGPAFFRHGCLPCILAAMDSEIDRASIQIAGVSVLCNVSASTERVKLLEAGALSRVVAAMRRHGNVAELQAICCKALRNMGDQIQEAIIRAGGVALIVAALDGFVHVPEVQQCGCEALQSIFVGDGRWNVIWEGGLSRIFTAMRRYADVAGIQEAGCGAIGNLSGIDQISIIVVHDGGLVDVFNAMDRHSDVASVQRAGCRALGNLSVNSKNKAKFVLAKGLKRIFSAMENHSDSAMVVSSGCEALLRLAWNGAHETTIAILAEGGLVRIFSAIDRHASVIDVQNAAFGALRNLVVNDDTKLRIVAEGGVERILAAMRRHLTSESLQELCCSILWKLSVDLPGNADAIIDAGGVRCILDAMGAHSGVADVQQAGCSALTRLIGRSWSRRDFG